jgi:hypothetical protein
MMRLGAIVVLASTVTATRTPAQVSFAGVPSTLTAPQSSATALSMPDSTLLRLSFPRPQETAETRHKSPVLAWFLSWLVPGGGQGYNGQWGKAAAFFIPAAVGFTLVVSNDGFDCTEDCGARDLGLGILIVSSIGSQIEAPFAASKINREAKKASASQVNLTLAGIRF